MSTYLIKGIDTSNEPDTTVRTVYVREYHSWIIKNQSVVVNKGKE